ncbi:MAG: hypothetical protein J6B40_05725 [Oscillospiraceae bacterium]|nr:hypothetical protein [Oscillospiraceae bacterium]
MFGYVRTFDSELKIGEFRAYKAIYCGLCKQLGRSFGLFARMTLSYDFTFLAALAMAVAEEEPAFEAQGCMCNPIKKTPCCLENKALCDAADCAMILLWEKLKDDLQDSGFVKKLGVRLLRPFARRPYRLAAARRPELARMAQEYTAAQNALEKAGCADVDQAAEPTAKLLSALLEELSRDEKQRRVLGRTGYLLGRFIYLCDALDDLEDDQKAGGYNPFLLRNAAKGMTAEEIRQDAKGSLYLTVSELGLCCDLLQLQRFAGIINNVLCLGLKGSVDQIMERKKQRERKELGV